MFNVKLIDGVLIAEDKIVLTDSQLKKLECEELQERINTMCKDLHISRRHVETNGNTSMSVVAITPQEFNNQVQHELEMTHCNLLSVIDDMTIPTKEEPTDQTETTEEDQTELEFVKEILKEIEEDDMICGSAVVSRLPMLGAVPCGIQICRETLINLLKCYTEHNK